MGGRALLKGLLLLAQVLVLSLCIVQLLERESEAQAVGCNVQAINELKTWTNIGRSIYGLPALQSNGALDYAAYIGSVYQSWWGMGHFYVAERIRPYGFSSWGENVAMRTWWGALTPQIAQQVNSLSVMMGWWNSPPHFANIVHGGFRYQGIACVQSGNTVYWTQNFGA